MKLKSDKTKAFWYYANFQDSEVWSGGLETRDEAIDAGRDEYDDGFFVVEATNPPVRISDWIETHRVIERANDSIMDSDRVTIDEECPFQVSPEQEADLCNRVKLACDQWQEAHGLTFEVQSFDWMSAQEPIPHGDH